MTSLFYHLVEPTGDPTEIQSICSSGRFTIRGSGFRVQVEVRIRVKAWVTARFRVEVGVEVRVKGGGCLSTPNPI